MFNSPLPEILQLSIWWSTFQSQIIYSTVFLIEYQNHNNIDNTFINFWKNFLVHLWLEVTSRCVHPLNVPSTHTWHNELCRAAAAAAKSLQSCPTLCDPMDCSPPGSPVPGILQARTLEWVAISFSNAGKWKVKGKSLSRVRLFMTPWTAAHQAPPSMGFSR